jgi:hypothetical protein
MVDKSGQEPGMTGQYSKRGGIQPIDFIVSNNLNFLEGSIVKYVYRYPFKGGVESLRKAQTYLAWLIASLREEVCDCGNKEVSVSMAETRASGAAEGRDGELQ